MKNLILIGIVTIITMIACGDQTVIDPVLSKKYLVEIKIPPNSNIEWVMRQDSSYILMCFKKNSRLKAIPKIKAK